MIIKYVIIFAVIIIFLLASFVFYAEVKQNIDRYRKSIGYSKNKSVKKPKTVNSNDVKRKKASPSTHNSFDADKNRQRVSKSMPVAAKRNANIKSSKLSAEKKKLQSKKLHNKDRKRK